ncbi:hypothetical protein L6R52_27335 [Myxococcota bacterium]|nr:hypothetical protein [Myxococcota bacterium]
MTTKTIKKKKTQTKASPPRGLEAAKQARRATKRASGSNGAAAHVNPNQAAFVKHEAAIRAVPSEARTQGRYSLEDAIDVALLAVERIGAYADRMPGFDRLIPGTLAAFEALPEYARALRYANSQYVVAQGSEGMARVPSKVVEEVKALTVKMPRVILYNLGHEQTIADRMAFLASGLGYRHQSLELEEYASVYEDRAADLAVDRRHYDPADAKRARELSLELNHLLGRPKGGSLAEWAELRASAHTLVVQRYDRLMRLLAAIEFDRPLDDFPSLASAVRALRSPRNGRRTDEDESPETDTPTPPATPSPSPSDEETPA